jgi:tetratricopeptide (TPR) repeat protein
MGDREADLLKQLDDAVLLHGSDHRSVGDIYYELADLYHRRGDVVRAKELFEQAYNIRLRKVGEEYEDTIDAYYRLCFLLDAENPDDVHAIGLRRMRLLELRERFDASTSPRIKITDTSVGQLFFDSTMVYCDIAEDARASGDFVTADTNYLKCIELRKSKYGQHSPALAPVLLNYAQSLQSQEKLPETELVLKQALDVNTRAYGAFHGTVAECLNKLGLVYARMQRYDEAEVTLREALRLRQSLFGDLNIIVASSLNNLAELYRERKDFITAIGYHNSAIEAYEKSVGVDHPGAVNARGNLGVTYRRQARVSTHSQLYACCHYSVKNTQSFVCRRGSKKESRW